jgi:phosphate:Na+ symporter
MVAPQADPRNTPQRMTGTWTLFDLAGAIALLLWGVHMVQTGIQRAFGPELRRLLGAALGDRGRAFGCGLAVTAILQSSTATGLMITGFAAGGAVALVPALSAMLGANVGTTLIVQLLSFNVAGISPVLILIGVLMFRRASQTRTRDLGRVAIGLGLMLMSLHQLLALVTPFEDAPSLRLLLGSVATEPVLDVLLAAVLTWAAHSSVAMVLLIMSLAAKGVVPLHAAFALVLGANLGTAINPLLEGAPGGGAARRLPLGNLAIRVFGSLVALAVLDRIGPWLVTMVPDPAHAVAMFHTGFNVVLAVIFLPLLGPVARLLRRWLPDQVNTADPGRPLHLDRAALDTPLIALAGATREALRMADVLELMMASAADALSDGDRRSIAETRRLEDVLDRLNAAIRDYLISVDQDALSEQDHRRMPEILTFITNLEHAGDVIDRNLMGHAARRLKRGLRFDRDQGGEIRRLIARLTANLRAAAAVFVTEDADAARLLASEKEVFRDLETAAAAAVFSRYRTSRPDSTEEGVLHLDLLRDLKRVNGHLVSAAAYPVLRGQGDLLPSRMR